MHDIGASLNPPDHYYNLLVLLFLSFFPVFVVSTLLRGFWPSFCIYFCAELLIAQSEFICQWIQTSGFLLAQRSKGRAGSQGRYWRTGKAFSWSISAYYNSDIEFWHPVKNFHPFNIVFIRTIVFIIAENVFYEHWHCSHIDFMCHKNVQAWVCMCGKDRMKVSVSVCKWDHLVLSKCRQDYDTVINRKKEVRKVKSLRHRY